MSSHSAAVEESIPPEDLYSFFNKHQKRWIIFLAALPGWFSTLSSFIYFPAIPAISRDLHTPIVKINLTITSYLLVSAVVPSVVGKAADTAGRRPVYLVILAIHLVANLGLALQSNFSALIVLRMIQAAGISGKGGAIYYLRGWIER